MKVEFNINNYVEFELTEYGANILNNYNDYYTKIFPSLYKHKYVEGEVKKMQLWDVISTFGEFTCLGSEVFCKNATIVLNIEKGEKK